MSSSELIVPSTPRGASSESSPLPGSSSASQTPEIVALRITYELPESYLSELETNQSLYVRATYCHPSDTSVQQIKKTFISYLLAKRYLPSSLNHEPIDTLVDQYRLAVGKELLVDKKTLQENRVMENGKPLSVVLCRVMAPSHDGQDQFNDEEVINVSDYVERETVKIKKKYVDVKLRIQEKVGDQVLTCDISCKNNKKFGVISKMYCQHRNYNPDDFVFATSVNHVLLKNEKSLSSMGMNESGTLYVINVYHKDLVSFK
ncbi:hypothetical protein FDP41_010795 [Naegleria fowleri]|uniref:Ubiquitin-like domain-containing protein n=1 Tax=Naegleria fowleri TaxID=5763 RepID=A0A6A5C4Z0_NAEFO|nr:uncharacterized protein FDP41_010795 [Naegleria fowleri]KAF0982816.1 hypothetical protein FDP41_010795 [Naegleria fowleri]CAG4708962.1 unnamed protein product [Naegleria fowleri]